MRSLVKVKCWPASSSGSYRPAAGSALSTVTRFCTKEFSYLLPGVTCFAYPFGCSDPDAKALVDELFPVTLMTTPKCADLAKGPHDLPRFTVTMKTDLEKLLR